MRDFTLMILAAGFGKRMGNLTKNIPKPLLKIKHTTLLSNTINFFEKLGCNKFIINTHYLHNKLEKYIKKNFSNKNIFISFESQLLDTGGGLKNAINYLKDEKILVTNSDIYWHSDNSNDINNFISKINKTNECQLLLSKKNNTLGINKNSGDFIIENNIVRRSKQNDPIFFYSGLQIINSKILNKHEGEIFSINKIWDDLIKEKKLQGSVMESKLFHIGDKKTYTNFN